MLAIEISGLPISTNASLMARGSRLIHTTAARNYRRDTTAAISRHLEALEGVEKMLEGWKGRELSLEIDLYGSWYTKKEKIKCCDCCNKEKLLVDSLFEALKVYDKEIDDCQLFSVNIRKITSDVEMTTIKLEVAI